MNGESARQGAPKPQPVSPSTRIPKAHVSDVRAAALAPQLHAIGSEGWGERIGAKDEARCYRVSRGTLPGGGYDSEESSGDSRLHAAIQERGREEPLRHRAAIVTFGSCEPYSVNTGGENAHECWNAWRFGWTEANCFREAGETAERAWWRQDR